MRDEALTQRLYRYVSEPEKEFIVNNRYIEARSRETFLSPDFYDSEDEARRYLALPPGPQYRYRVGPIWALDITFDGVPLRRVPPAFGQPGGGFEISTHQRIPYGTFESLS